MAPTTCRRASRRRSWPAARRRAIRLAVAPDAAIVEFVRDAAAAELGAAPPIGGADWTAFIAGEGIATVVFGPGGAGAHADEEWVSTSDTETVARTLLAVARRLCA